MIARAVGRLDPALNQAACGFFPFAGDNPLHFVLRAITNALGGGTTVSEITEDPRSPNTIIATVAANGGRADEPISVARLSTPRLSSPRARLMARVCWAHHARACFCCATATASHCYLPGSCGRDAQL